MPANWCLQQRLYSGVCPIYVHHENNITGYSSAFELKTRDRLYVFIAPNTETMSDWIRAISETAFSQPVNLQPAPAQDVDVMILLYLTNAAQITWAAPEQASTMSAENLIYGLVG